MNLVIYLCFARSGGTLLNRCLGSLDKTFIFSEITPLAYYNNVDDKRRTIYSQAQDWYGIDIKSRNLIDNIYEINQKYSDHNIIIRDWTFSNYSKVYKDVSPPNNIHIIDLLYEKYPFNVFSFIRNPIDIYLSLSVKMNYELESFSKIYLQYTEEIIRRNIQYYKYEDFVNNPKKVFKEICHNANIKYSDKFLKFYEVENVLGDKQFYYFTRGKKKTTFLKLKRKRTKFSLVKKIDNESRLFKSNAIFKYKQKYHGQTLENIFVFYVDKYKHFIFLLLIKLRKKL